MTAKVSLLEEASHTVRLTLGFSEDGNRKGNKAKPAAAMTPAGTSAEHRKAGSGRARSSTAPAAPSSASATAGHGRPLCSQPPATRATLFAVGLEGPSWAIALTMR